MYFFPHLKDANLMKDLPLKWKWNSIGCYTANTNTQTIDCQYPLQRLHPADYSPHYPTAVLLIFLGLQTKTRVG